VKEREFQVVVQILFVFAEAQEFIPAYDKARGIDCCDREKSMDWEDALQPKESHT